MASTKRISAPVIALVCGMALLSGCTHLNKAPVIGDAVDSMNGQQHLRESRTAIATDDAISAGDLNDALVLAQRDFKMHRHSVPSALRYATLLRKAGKPEGALKILGPFALHDDGTPKGDADGAVLNEIASDDIALGHFDKAETVLNGAMNVPKLKPEETDTYNLMGVALDAQGNHAEAEKMFRMALDGWQGNPTSVMNNLALSLASQGKFDEALSILRKALVMAPDKPEIARNIDIISQLRDSVVTKAKVVTVHKKVVKKVTHHHKAVKKQDCKTVTVCNPPK